MNGSNDNLELRKQVERVVRPLKAEFERKMRIREELLALVLQIHAEEQTRATSPEEARDRTLERFGEPAALTAELQAAVPRHEVWTTALDRWLAHKPAESITRHALRMAALPVVLYPLLAAIAQAALLLRGSSLDFLQLRVIWILCAFTGANTFVLVWLMESFGEQAERHTLPLWRVPRLWFGAALATATVSLAGIAIMAAAGGTWRDVEWAARHWLRASPLVVGLYVAMSLLFASLRRRAAPWKRLELD